MPLHEKILAHLTERATESRFPLRIVHDVRQVMPEDGVVCLDNGIYKIWFARNHRTHVANTLLLDNALATMGAGWGHAPKRWRRAARRSIAPVSVWCAGDVKGAAAGAAARTVLGRSRRSFAFQAPETWHAPISMRLPESLQLFDEIRVKGP